MKLTIGENIRALRREKNITQEDFAAMFGVTYQSVSRWETGVCYPDLELLPQLAAFFGVTVDRLRGADTALEQREVDSYLARYQDAISRGAVNACIAVAREGVAAYPNNYALLNKLMDALFIASDEDGNVPNWRENQLAFDAEITALGERIMKYCPDQAIRLEATWRLAFNHCEMGRREQGRRIYDTLPPMEWCRENRIWYGLEEHEKEPFLRQTIRSAYEMLTGSIRMLIKAGRLSDAERITLTHRIFAIDELVADGHGRDYTWFNARCLCDLAHLYARMGDGDAAVAYLNRAIDAAIAFDERPEEFSYESLMLGTVTKCRSDYETSDERPLRVILRDKWMQKADFSAIAEREDFQAAMARLG